jgi:hypothetical protein
MVQSNCSALNIKLMGKKEVNDTAYMPFLGLLLIFI